MKDIEMSPNCNIIVAATAQNGIGMNGTLPWMLRKEMSYFSRMTKTTRDPHKQNAVVMGRKTWESIPERNRPLPNRLNLVLSRQKLFLGNDVTVQNSFKSAMHFLSGKADLETIWIIGGSSVYKEVLDSSLCQRIYLTKIFKEYECDTFFPEIDSSFKEVTDFSVPQGRQEENGVEYEYKVYERQIF